MSLTIEDYADYELLQTIEKEPKGTTQDLAETLGREVRSVASRLVWMRKMGFIDITIAKNWVLTTKGRVLLSSSNVKEVRSLTSRVRSNPSMSWALRREFNRGL